MSWIVVISALMGASSPDTFNTFFTEFKAKRDGIRCLEAKFTQENITSDDTTHSEGTIIFVQPRRIIFRYEKPEPETVYLIDGKRAYEYEAEIKQIQIYDLDENPQTEIFFLGFDNDTENLQKGYDIKLFETDDAAQGKRGIELSPKKSAEHEDGGRFEKVQLSLREKDFLPYQIHIINDKESETYIKISGYSVNQTIEPVRTQITLPEGTKVIENEQVVETVNEAGKTVPGKPVEFSITDLPPVTPPTEKAPEKTDAPAGK